MERNLKLIFLNLMLLFGLVTGLGAQNQVETKVTIIKETIDEHGTKKVIKIEKEGPEAEKIDIEALSEGKIELEWDVSDKIVIEEEIETEHDGEIRIRKRFQDDGEDLEDMFPGGFYFNDRSFPFQWEYHDRFDVFHQKPRLGVMISDHEEKGAVVNEVMKGSPAEKAGLLEGDIIIEVDREEIEDADDLVEYIREEDDDGILELNLIRDDEEIVVKAELLINKENNWTRKL